MKISTKGRYGLRILLDLVLHYSDEPRQIRDICSSQKLSEKYVGRLIIPLRKAGLVECVRGAQGGVKLKADPSAVTLLEVVEIMEGAVNVVSCVLCPKKCSRARNCASRMAWKTVNDALKLALSKITLADVAKDGSVDELSGGCL